MSAKTGHGGPSAAAVPMPYPSHRASLRENLESIALAVLLVLIVRQLVVEAFKIPTGSMAPTLLGVHKEVRCVNCGWVFRVGYNKLGVNGEVKCPNCGHLWPGGGDNLGTAYEPDEIAFRWPAWLWNEARTQKTGRRVNGIDAANRVDRWGSRIFVNKFIYHLRKPRRWEVAVFLYPFADVRCLHCHWSDVAQPAGIHKCPRCGSNQLAVVRKNYIKRIVGLPGERVTIRNGDVYVNGEIARKPPAVQKGLWQHVLDSSYVPRRDVPLLWSFGVRSALWTRDAESGALSVDALREHTPVWARLTPPIRDLCAYNRPPDDGLNTGVFVSGRHDVGDCRLELECTAERAEDSPSARLVLRIEEDEHDFVVRLPVGREGQAELLDAGRLLEAQDVPALRVGERARVALENYDDFLVLWLNGEAIMRHAYEGSPRPARRAQEVAFGATQAEVTFHRIRIARDIYYLDMNDSGGDAKVYELDQQSYFVLGDNSAESSDSRFWPSPEVPAEYLLGSAFAVFWPIHDIALLSTGSR